MNQTASPLGLVSNIADFGNDIVTLTELQAKLAAYDAKEAASRAILPLAVLGVGAVLALASLPVILIGLADLIARSTRISGGMAQLVVGLVTLLLALLACLIGARGSLQSLDSFRRSREELTRNLSWIRTVLIYSGRTGGKRRV
jgi:membrane protease YdiL (CAAX protease family)